MSSITRKLFCLIEGENIPFRVTVTSDDCVASLRVAVLEQCKNDLHGIDAGRLVLWKVSFQVSRKYPAEILLSDK